MIVVIFLCVVAFDAAFRPDILNRHRLMELLVLALCGHFKCRKIFLLGELVLLELMREDIFVARLLGPHMRRLGCVLHPIYAVLLIGDYSFCKLVLLYDLRQVLRLLITLAIFQHSLGVFALSVIT